MDLTFTLGSLDLHQKLANFQVLYEVTTRKVVTTLDEVEHAYPAARRAIVRFALLPMTDAAAAVLYDALLGDTVTLTYTDPHQNADVTRIMRLTSDLEATFGLRSIDGNRYYKGSTIELRQVG